MVYENPINNTNRFVLQECGDFTWRVSDCEELVGVITGDDVADLAKRISV